MTQKELIDELYATKKFKEKKDVRIFMEVLEKVFKNKIVTEEKIVIKNIGTFKLERSKRKRYLPKEENVVEKEFINIRFKPSSNIKKFIMEKSINESN